MADKLYFIKGYDEHSIYLRQFVFRFITVSIPRASIASISNIGGIMHVETTGHKTYKVGEGFKAPQRRLTQDAMKSPITV